MRKLTKLERFKDKVLSRYDVYNNIFCKIRSKNTNHAKEIIFMIDDIDGVSRTETMISLEESINDKKRLMHKIFNEIK